MEDYLYSQALSEAEGLLESTYYYIPNEVLSTAQVEFRQLLSECVRMYNSAPELFAYYKTSRIQSIDTDITCLQKKGLCTKIREDRRTMLCIIFEAIDTVTSW